MFLAPSRQPASGLSFAPATRDASHTPVQQTLLSLFALVLASTLSFGAQQRAASGSRDLIRSEVELLIAGVAESTFDQLAELPFDANGAATEASQLAAPGAFGGRAWSVAADLDDVHTASTTVVRTVGSGTVTVGVTARVEYVVKQGTGFAATPTTRQLYKRVTLDLSGPAGASASLSRVYALDGL